MQKRVNVKQCTKVGIFLNGTGDISAPKVDKRGFRKDTESGDGEPAAARDFNYKLTTNEKLIFS